MPVFDSCCCLSLKTVCKILGIVGIIAYAIIAARYVVLLMMSTHEMAGLSTDYIASLIGSIIYIISNVCLVIGAYKDRSGLVMVFLILTDIGIPLDIIMIIIEIAYALIPDVIRRVMRPHEAIQTIATYCILTRLLIVQK